MLVYEDRSSSGATVEVMVGFIGSRLARRNQQWAQWGVLTVVVVSGSAAGLRVIDAGRASVWRRV